MTLMILVGSRQSKTCDAAAHKTQDSRKFALVAANLFPAWGSHVPHYENF
jgi:hypothetical protein